MDLHMNYVVVQLRSAEYVDFNLCEIEFPYLMKLESKPLDIWNWNVADTDMLNTHNYRVRSDVDQWGETWIKCF